MTEPNTADPRAAANARLASLRRFFEAEPNNQRLRRDVVNTAVAAGEFAYVRELAEQRLAATPADPEAQFDRATALIGLQDFAAALEALNFLDATIPGVRFNTGLCLFMLARFEEARPYFQAGYDAGERSAGQLRCFIRALHHVGAVDEAFAVVKANEALIASDPELAGVAALLCIDAGDTAYGARFAQASLARNPDNTDALVTAGSVHALELDVPRARAAFERTLSLQQENPRAWFGLGTLSMGEQNFSAAREQLERAAQGMPGHIGTWHALGWVHLFSGDLDAAERVFTHALELNRNFSESHGSLAVLAAMRGDRAAAERGIEIAERLDRSCMTSKYAATLLLSSAEEQRAQLVNLIEKVPVQGPRFAELLRRSGKGPKGS